MPPWYQTDWGPGEHVQERLAAFFRTIPGQNPDEFELRYNWLSETIDLVRWLPSFDEGDRAIDVVHYIPVDLDSWPAALGFEYMLNAATFARWRGSLQPIAPSEFRHIEAEARGRHDARLEVMQLADLVRLGFATPEQVERYESALRITDPDGWQMTYDLADRMRKPMQRLADEQGV